MFLNRMVSNKREVYSVKIINKLTLMFMISCLILLTQTSVFAATTPAGTLITNYATATYKDASNNTYDVQSNEVITTVIQVYGVDILPDKQIKEGEKGLFTYFPLDVVNTGNGPDTFNLNLSNLFSYTHPTNNSWTFAMYADSNGNGILETIEKSAGPINRTALMNPDGVFDLILEVSVPSGAPDDMTCSATVTAISQGNPSKTDSAICETKLIPPPITPVKKVNGATHSNAFPGDTLNYTIDVTNTGSENLTSVKLRDTIPDRTTYISSNPVGIFSGGVVEWNIPILSAGETRTYALNVKVNNYFKGTIQNQAIVLHKGVEIPSDPVTTEVETYYGIFVDPSRTKDAIPGETVTFPFVIKNEGNLVDRPDLILAPLTGTTVKYTWDFFRDLNGNGNKDPDDTKLFDIDGDFYPNTPQINPGETITLLALAIVSTTAEDGEREQVIVTGRSNGDISKKDEISLTINVKAPKVTLGKFVDPASGQQPPGTTLTYTLKYRNIGQAPAYSVTITDTVPTHTSYIENTVRMGTSLATLISKTDKSDFDEVTVGDKKYITINVTRDSQNPLDPGEEGYIQFKVTID